MRRKNFAGVIVLVALALPALAAAQEGFGLRDAPLTDDLAPLQQPPHRDDDRRQTRNYPEQPPVIPHSIDGYEISLRGNKCLSCHSRRRAAKTGAPMTSVSHFMDRDMQVLSDVSPRRYFCVQCHVPQTQVAPPVPNTFIDSADLPRP